MFRPLFSSILRDRRLGSVICGAALLQLILAFLNFPSWPCPIFHTLGIPCPGCGMTRATLFLVRGEWKEALTLHAFAPVLLIAFAVIAFCAIAPRTHTERIAARIEVIESHTGITILLLSGLILYWLARMLILQTAFVRLING
ncbi:MAG TPA: DUF2752 domain-containing protein [Pyrinomonadaceae bacterium]|nr:DUF2752 domain-containing protein [Pyrinomonadaceae bacterium]